MCRRTWKRDDLYITYGNPSIQPFNEQVISTMKEVMYFYYSIDIFSGNKNIFHANAYDFPKVQNLPDHIDYLINTKEEDMFTYEDIEMNGFCRQKLYSFINLNDSFNMDCEYFYKLEKVVTYIKQSNQDNFQRHEEYTLTTGKSEPNKKGYSNGESYGKEIFIKHLTIEDLMRLKQVAIEFCNATIKSYNENIKKTNEVLIMKRVKHIDKRITRGQLYRFTTEFNQELILCVTSINNEEKSVQFIIVKGNDFYLQGQDFSIAFEEDFDKLSLLSDVK